MHRFIPLLLLCYAHHLCTEESVHEVDINAAARLAIARSELVLAAEARRQAARTEGSGLTAFARPQVGVGAHWAYLGDDYRGPMPGHSADQHYRLDTRVEQLLWSSGRLEARRHQAQALDQVATGDLRQQHLSVALRARSAGSDVLLARARIAVTEQRVEQRRGEYRDAEALFEAGSVTQLDVRQARLALIAAESQADEAVSEERHALKELAASLALEPEAVVFTDELSPPDALEALVDAARRAIGDDPEFMVLRGQQERLIAEEAVWQAAGLPQVHAYGEAFTQGRRVDDLHESWSVGLSLRWDIYGGGAFEAARDSARHQHRALRQHQHSLLRERCREIEQLDVMIASLQRRITAQQTAAELAASNYEDARRQYQAGLITLTRVGESSLAVGETRFALDMLVHRLQKIAHRLRWLAGSDLE